MHRFAMATLAAAIMAVSVFTAQPAHAYSAERFVEQLIAHSIVPLAQAARARELVAFLVSRDLLAVSAEKTPSGHATGRQPNSEFVTVRASQFIEHGTRTYEEGEDVEGLIMIVESSANHAVELTARRRCGVSYKIFDEDDTQLYDSASVPPCKDAEQVRYVLPQGGHRIFRIRHEAEAYPLAPGEYTFLLEYPGYGADEREVTIRAQ